MSMSDQERAELGARIEAERLRRFDKASDAYVAAGLSSGTWASLERGASTKPLSVRKAVRLLWPETDGDWRKIPAEGERTGVAEPDRIAELTAAVAALAQRVAALEVTRGDGPVRAQSRGFPDRRSTIAPEARPERRRVPRD